MTIYRNGVAIKLTREELKAAYEEFNLNQRIQDAEIHFKSWIDYEELKADPVKLREFIDQYGYSPDAALDGNSEAYAMETLAEMFIDQIDGECNTAENDLWHRILTEFMESERRHHMNNI